MQEVAGSDQRPCQLRRQSTESSHAESSYASTLLALAEAAQTTKTTSKLAPEPMPNLGEFTNSRTALASPPKENTPLAVVLPSPGGMSCTHLGTENIPDAIKISPFFHVTHALGGEPGIAIWNLYTCEMVGCNESMVRILEIPTLVMLGNGLKWTSFFSSPRLEIEEILKDSLVRMRELHDRFLQGRSCVGTLSVSLATIYGNLKRVSVYAVTMPVSLLHNHPLPNAHTGFSPVMQSRREAPMGVLWIVYLSDSEHTASPPTVTEVTPRLEIRKFTSEGKNGTLREVKRKAKRPWEENMTKFTLSKMTKWDGSAESRTESATRKHKSTESLPIPSKSLNSIPV